MSIRWECRPLWMAPFPRKAILNCLRVKNASRARPCIHSLLCVPDHGRDSFPQAPAAVTFVDCELKQNPFSPKLLFSSQQQGMKWRQKLVVAAMINLPMWLLGLATVLWEGCGERWYTGLEIHWVLETKLSEPSQWERGGQWCWEKRRQWRPGSESLKREHRLHQEPN